jgi:hypothetical protein
MFDIKRLAKLVAEGRATAGDQKELDRLVKSYNDLLQTQDSLVSETKSLTDGTAKIDVNTGKVVAPEPEKKPIEREYKYGIYDGTVNGKKVKVVQTSDGTIFLDQKPFTGKIQWADNTSSEYIEGIEKKLYEGSRNEPVVQKKEEKKPTGTVKKPSGVVKPTEVKPETPAVTPEVKPQDLKGLLAKTEFWYDLPDYIFETVPELGDLLVKAVNKNWDAEKFLSSAKLTKWWQSNGAVFRTRMVDKAKYNELRANNQDVSKTDYGQYLSRQIRNVKAQAKSIAGVTLDDAQAQQIAEKIYDGNLDDDPLAINRLIIPFIGKVTDRYGKTDVTTYGGQALQNYQILQSIAKSNGLSLKDILPQISTTLTGGDLEKAVLQGIASGDIDINRVAQNARMVAAQGQPEYVRNLLNQGYDLAQIYAPYKQTMASILELDPEQIDLNDPTLRSAINNNGDMNIYDFKKALRRDNRWQYTQAAREDVSSAALQVLRDFGFQG